MKDLDPDSVGTFADRRISTGELYSKNGFEIIEITKPNYFYFKSKAISNISRQRCQKHKLPKLLGDEFCSSLSETENMLKAGFTQVFDAGHVKLLWQKTPRV